MRLRWTFNRAVRGRCAAGTTLIAAGSAAIPTKLDVDEPGYLKTLRTVEEGYEDRDAPQCWREFLYNNVNFQRSPRKNLSSLLETNCKFTCSCKRTFCEKVHDAAERLPPCRASLSPSDRLRLMFLTDEDGQFGPEVQFIQSVFGMSLGCGSLVGGYAYGSEAFKRFMAENKQTMFENPRDAQQAMRVRV